MKTLNYLTIFCLLSLCTFSCKKENESTNSNQNVSNEQVSYFGNLLVVQDSIEYTEPIDLSYKDSSVIVGSFFVKSDGSVANFSGSKTTNKINISGTITGICPGNFQGSIDILENNQIKVSISGNNCDGGFSASGNLSKQACIKVKGKYFVEETVDIAITVDGQTQTQHTEGNGYIQLAQQNCSISYTVPGTSTMRSGEVKGNKFILSGDFIIPQSGMNLTKNQFYAEVDINDNYSFQFTGKGIAQGTYNGSTFSVTGTDKGVLNKYFDAVVAIFRGGIYEEWSEPNLNQMKEQVDNVYEDRVWTNVIYTKLQNERLRFWLNNQVYQLIPDHHPLLILVGHSAGANAIRVGDYTTDNLFSRISIDPVDPRKVKNLWDETANQRDITFTIDHPQGDYFNYLAFSTDGNTNGYKLLGYHVSQSTEQVEANTNHFSIVDRVVEQQYVLNEVTRCLGLKQVNNPIKSNNEFSFPINGNIRQIITVINVHR